jgi:hypothetical protein
MDGSNGNYRIPVLEAEKRPRRQQLPTLAPEGTGPRPSPVRSNNGCRKAAERVWINIDH